jgi:hypothetical protein
MRGWHHGYLGAILVIVGLYFELNWALIIGGIIVLDEVTQIVFGQYGGFLHWAYIKTLYQIKIVRDFNFWLDSIFGKKR